jgi:formamidopyrimidine-DNA glycosylase
LSTLAMPELPEVRVHAERLNARYPGDRLERFELFSFAALKTFSPEPSQAVGRTLDSVTSRGKCFILAFGDLVFVVHLRQGGRLTPDPKLGAKPRGGLARWRFEREPSLLFTEAGKEHRAGVWVADSPDSAEPLVGLGPEADSLTDSELGEILTAAKGARLHGVLRDQRALAGIGRRLANEICWAAKLSPFAPAKSVSDVAGLNAAITACIAASITDERTRDSMVASADRLSMVHSKTGEACPRCSDTIRAVSYQAYTVNYCATCQTGGKILADNTTSKFLK